MIVLHWLAEIMNKWDGGLRAKIAKSKKTNNNTRVLLQTYLDNILSIALINAEGKFDKPAQILADLKLHVGDDGKL